MKCPIPFEDLVDYWAGEETVEELEEHLMGCAVCTRASAQVAAITETFRGSIPPLLSGERLAALLQKGLRIVENPMQPGERREVLFPKGVDILLHRLGGLSLSGADKVSFILRDEHSGRVMLSVDDAPFERESGEVLIACQMHYSAMPPDTVAEVRAHHGMNETLTTYTILHRFER